MSIVNVNSFESRISDKNFLTNYTDKYLKQSLANMGQRLSVKGDSIVVKSFKVSDLFSNYLGSFNQENLMVQFKYYPEGYTDETSLYENYRNSVVGTLVYLQEDGSRKTLNELTNGKSANSSISILNTNNILSNIDSDDYATDIYINESDGTNGSAYWHRDKAIIAKLYDTKLSKNVYLFRLVGHNTEGQYGPYDNEFIFDEITEDGEFVSGIRIFMANEQHLMLNSENLTDIMQENSSDIVSKEHLVMFYLHKDEKYGTKGYTGSKWQLSVYEKNPEYIVEIGDITTDTSDDLISMLSQFEVSDSSKPEDIVTALATSYSSEALYQLSASGEAMFKHLYDIPVSEDTEDNVGFKADSYNADKANDFSNYIAGQDTNPDIDDDADKEIINTRLEYFVNDTTEIFPVVRSIFNSIMYEDSDNLKIKKQVVAQFIKRLYDDYILQDGILESDKISDYEVCVPYDLEFKYNGNSNVSSIIYNTTTSLSTQFLNISSDVQLDIHKTLEKIANTKDDDGVTMTNSQLVVANAKEEKTVMYDLVINYIDDDIISDISWYPSFTLPYINSKGYWTVNDIETSIYAKGSSDNSSGLVILSSDDPTRFNKDTGFVFASGADTMKGWDFTKRNFASEVINSNMNKSFIIGAYLPSDDTLTNIAGTNEFSYINNSLVCVMSSANMESDLYTTYNVYSNDDLDVVKDVYNKTYSNPIDGITYYLYSNNNGASYIYYRKYREDSLYNILGEDSIVTSFWQVEKKTNYETKSTYYTMSYLTRPGENIALDLTYIGGLEQFVKHYASSSFNPDNFFHRWIVFSGIQNKLKNNTIDANAKTIYPLIRNYDSTYFTKYGEDISRSLGEEVVEGQGGTTDNEITNQQYANNLNLSIEFTDTISQKSDEIVGTNNSKDQKHFRVFEYAYTYQQPKTVKKIDENGNPVVSIEKDIVTKNYGYIPYAIQYTKFPNEYIPNTYYNANDSTSTYQYPELDLKEVLIKNATSFNRYNILGVDRKELNGTYRGVLYNAYIGTAFDQEDKSHLKIGTGSTNPNLGTSTMMYNDDIAKLTPMDSVDVEFAYINLAGDTYVSGNLTSSNTIWKATPIYYNNKITLYTYSTIVVPASYLVNNSLVDGKLEYITNENAPKYNSNLLTYNIVLNDNTRYYSRYVQGQTDNSNRYTYYSYLNVHKLLEENHVDVDKNSIIYGDSTVLTTRKTVKTGREKDIYNRIILANQMYQQDPGLFRDMVTYVGSNYSQNSYEDGTYKDCLWYQSALDKYLDPENINIGDFYNTVYPYIGTSLEYGKIIVWGSYGDELTNLYMIENNIDSKKVSYISSSTPCPEGWIYSKAIGLSYINYIPDEENFAHFLQLSTNLLDQENYQANCNSYQWGNSEQISDSSRPIVVANPIEISYTDIPSYCSSIKFTEDKKVFCYMYVDGIDLEDGTYTADTLHDKLKDYYKIAPAEVDSKKSWLWPDDKKYSYNEEWTCTGCDKCSQYSCKLIGVCKHSSIQGSFRISYGFYTFKDVSDSRVTNQMIQDAINQHVFRYQHKRYYQDEKTGAISSYYTYSYYPVTVWKELDPSAPDYIEQITYKDEYNNKYVLNDRDEFVSYDTPDVKYAKRIAQGYNILCSYNYDVIEDYAKSSYSYSYYVTKEDDKNSSQEIVMTYSYMPVNNEVGKPTMLRWHSYWVDINGDTQTWDSDILSVTCTYTYTQDACTPVEDVNYPLPVTTEKTINSVYAYMDTVDLETKDMYLTYRYVNVRELYSNHTTPEYYNGVVGAGN